jgi:hypothetical protein
MVFLLPSSPPGRTEKYHFSFEEEGRKTEQVNFGGLGNYAKIVTFCEDKT